MREMESQLSNVEGNGRSTSILLECLRKATGILIHNAQPVHRIVQAKDCEPQRLSVFAAFCSSFTIAFRQSPLDRQPPPTVFFT
jgi:hypothetical protein